VNVTNLDDSNVNQGSQSVAQINMTDSFEPDLDDESNSVRISQMLQPAAQPKGKANVNASKISDDSAHGISQSVAKVVMTESDAPEIGADSNSMNISQMIKPKDAKPLLDVPGKKHTDQRKEVTGPSFAMDASAEQSHTIQMVQKLHATDESAMEFPEDSEVSRTIQQPNAIKNEQMNNSANMSDLSRSDKGPYQSMAFQNGAKPQSSVDLQDISSDDAGPSMSMALQ